MVRLLQQSHISTTHCVLVQRLRTLSHIITASAYFFSEGPKKRTCSPTTAGQYWTPAGITDCPTGRSLAHTHKLFMCCSAAVRRPNHMDSSSERLPAVNTQNPRAESKSNCIAETRRELRRRELRRRELRRRERDGESRGGESLGGESLGGES